MTASDIFEVFAADHTVELPALPVTDFVRLDTPTVYAIHDYGLIGTGECLYIGKTERPFENLYERFVVASSPFRTKLEADAEADSDPAEADGGSNYLYENTRVSVATVEDPEQLTALERAAIGRVGPRYNTQSRYAGGYLDLPADAQAKVDTLIGGEMVRAKVGGTYALVALASQERISSEESRSKLAESKT